MSGLRGCGMRVFAEGIRGGGGSLEVVVSSHELRILFGFMSFVLMVMGLVSRACIKADFILNSFRDEKNRVIRVKLIELKNDNNYFIDMLLLRR